MEEIMLFDDEFERIATNGIVFTDMSGNKKFILGNCVFTSAGYHFIDVIKEGQLNGKEIVIEKE